MTSEPVERDGTRRILVGVVTSDKMDKTITVSVDRLVLHPKFKKYIRKSTVLKAHDDAEEAKVGDRVEVMECRPLSKSKRYRLVRVVAKSSGAGALPGEVARS
jgi:small subunit ribosomal protein S17